MDITHIVSQHYKDKALVSAELLPDNIIFLRKLKDGVIRSVFYKFELYKGEYHLFMYHPHLVEDKAQQHEALFKAIFRDCKLETLTDDNS